MEHLERLADAMRELGARLGRVQAVLPVPGAGGPAAVSVSVIGC